MILATIEGPLRAIWLGVLVVLAAVWLVLWIRQAWRTTRPTYITVTLTLDTTELEAALRRASESMRAFSVRLATVGPASEKAARAVRELGTALAKPPTPPTDTGPLR